MKTRDTILAGLVLSLALGACSGGGGPAPSPDPSDPPASTQPIPKIGSPEQAGAFVVASDPRFAGITRKDPNLIGQGSWWQAEPREGGYRVQVQIGWGDCPAGCINRHDWTFDVAADGTLTLVEESGEPLPGT